MAFLKGFLGLFLSFSRVLEQIQGIYQAAGRCRNGSACGYCHWQHLEPKLDKRQRILLKEMPKGHLLFLKAVFLFFCLTEGPFWDYFFIFWAFERHILGQLLTLLISCLQMKERKAEMEEQPLEIQEILRLLQEELSQEIVSRSLTRGAWKALRTILSKMSVPTIFHFTDISSLSVASKLEVELERLCLRA